jgi:3,4-dihydroxy 2-butanone 4-phosphate synthase / GTP cyclohydrolase II
VTEAPRVERVATTSLPTEHGDFQAHAYRDLRTGADHLALVCGDVAGAQDVLLRPHSECLTGDVLGSRRCDCGQQLDTALAAIAHADRGVLVYLRGHEGRGIGLAAKLQAYALQDVGHDTVDANLALGLPSDAREYGAVAAVLADLGVASVRVLSNNPDKIADLRRGQIDVRDRVPLVMRPMPENLRYLRTKRDRMGHDLNSALTDELADSVSSDAS